MSRLLPSDVIRLATRGLQGQPLRFALSVLGISVGVAAMVAVGGITQSSRVELDRQIAALGTNLLTVVPTNDFQGQPTRLPTTAPTMLGNIAPVTEVSAVGVMPDVYAYRTPHVPSGRTSSVIVAAVDPSLLATLHGTLADGNWFTKSTARFPTAVLGSAAAARLGISAAGPRLWVDNQWVVIVGVLRPLPLAPDLDASVMLPSPAASDFFGHDGTSTAIYLRAPESQVIAVSTVAAATAQPQQPQQVAVARPSDALTAKQAADNVLNRLLFGMAAIGVLVGGIGVSNTMIVAGLERRSEIGLRRSLGATRGHITIQFLAESVLMSTCGGLAGTLFGYIVTAYYAHSQGWELALPIWIGCVAIALTSIVGGIAGLYPAVKASRLAPVTALASV